MIKNLAFTLFGVVIGIATIAFFSPGNDSLERSDASRFPSISSRAAPDESTIERLSDDAIANAEQVGAAARDDESQAEPYRDSDDRASPIDLTTGRQELAAPDGSSQQSGQIDVLRTADTGEAALPPLLPDEYQSLVEPPQSRVLRTDELFAKFSAEGRDELWAYPMELGINQHIARSVVPGTVIESIECRTSSCVIAGYVQPGFTDRHGELVRGMVQSGWWQASSSTFNSGSDADGVARFVTIIPRTEDDMMDVAPSDSSRNPRDSTTRRHPSESSRA